MQNIKGIGAFRRLFRQDLIITPLKNQEENIGYVIEDIETGLPILDKFGREFTYSTLVEVLQDIDRRFENSLILDSHLELLSYKKKELKYNDKK